MKNQHLKNFAIGTYLLLCGIWMIFATVYHGVRLFQMFTSEDFSIEYFRMVLYIYIGSFVTDSLFLISGVMCIIAFVRLKDGRYIVRAGAITLVAYVIPCITFYIYQRTFPLRTAVYLIIPVLIIACGKYWSRYMDGKSPDDRPNKMFPFVNELKCYLEQKREQH